MGRRVRAAGCELLALAALGVGLLLLRGWWLGVAPDAGRLVVVTAVVVLFGATRIGDIGKGFGRGIREFRRELRDGQDEDKQETDEKEPAATDEKKR